MFMCSTKQSLEIDFIYSGQLFSYIHSYIDTLLHYTLTFLFITDYRPMFCNFKLTMEES